MKELIYDKKIVPDAPETAISELQNIAFHMMSGFTKLPEGQQKHALQSAIKTISANLNELRTMELTKKTE